MKLFNPVELLALGAAGLCQTRVLTAFKSCSEFCQSLVRQLAIALILAIFYLEILHRLLQCL